MALSRAVKFHTTPATYLFGCTLRVISRLLLLLLFCKNRPHRPTSMDRRIFSGDAHKMVPRFSVFEHRATSYMRSLKIIFIFYNNHGERVYFIITRIPYLSLSVIRRNKVFAFSNYYCYFWFNSQPISISVVISKNLLDFGPWNKVGAVPLVVHHTHNARITNCVETTWYNEVYLSKSKRCHGRLGKSSHIVPGMMRVETEVSNSRNIIVTGRKPDDNG